MMLIDDILNASCARPTPQARDILHLSLLDWLACGMAGANEPVAQAVRGLVEDEGGTPQAGFFGGGRGPARAAALLNGAASHALDYDDTHFAHIGHPSVAVMPAALALAERQGAGFEAFEAAALAGCEASVRFGVLFGRAHYQVGFHQTATAGAFGATVAAGLLLGLGRERMRHALGLVSTRASGLKSQFGTMGKPFNAGIAAANGVEAAVLASRGFVSDPGALDGVNGFLATHHAEGVAGQPAGFLMEEVSHKLHACCHGLHAMLEALASLEVSGDAVEMAEITTHPRWLTVCNIAAPATGLELKFSYRAAAALHLAGHDTAALETWSDARAADPSVTALRDRVTVMADDTLPETACRVRLRVGGGWHAAAHDLDQPMGLTTLTKRLARKAEALVGADKAAALRAAVSGRSLEDLRRVMV